MEPDHLVGREAEIGRLRGFLDRAIGGETSICLVTGEPGAGKTSLLAKFASEGLAQHPELLIARGECDALGDAGDPYLPFREILRDLTGETAIHPGDQAVGQGSETRLRSLFRMTAKTVLENGPDLVDIFVPGAALAARLGGKAARHLARGKGSALPDPESRTRSESINPENIFEQYVQVLRAIAAERPLVLILDDLHWADSGSVGLLFHLARRLVSDPVLVVGAYRAEEVERRRHPDPHPLLPVVSELKRIHGAISVDLDQQDAAGFIDALIDSRPNRLDESFRRSLADHTGGNPLFAVELLAALESSGALASNQAGEIEVAGKIEWSALPSRVEGVIQGMMSRLSDRQREILEVACVQGEEFSAEVTARVLEEPKRRLIKELSGALGRESRIITAAGVQSLGSTSVSTYRFRHNLYQSYLYDSLDEIETASLHEEVGRALEEIHAGEEELVAFMLAHHFANTPDWRRTLRYSVLAGDRACESIAPREAVTHYAQALSLVRQRREAEGEMDLPAAALAERLADQYDLLGQNDEALTAYQQALAETPEHDAYARARLHAKMSAPLQRAKDYPRAHAVLDEAEAALGAVRDEDDGRWWRAWIDVQHERAFIHYWTGESDMLEAVVSAMEPAVEGWGSRSQKLNLVATRVRHALRDTRFRPDEQLVGVLQQSVASLEEETPASVRMRELFQLGFVLLWVERFEDAVRVFRESIDVYRLCGDAVLRLRVLMYMSIALRRLGRAEQVGECLDDAEALAEQLGVPDYRGLIAAQRGWLAWKDGDTARAETDSRHALEIWQESAPRYPVKWTGLWVQAALAADDGDYDTVTESIRQMLEQPQARLGPDLEEAMGEVLEARSASGLDRLQSAVERAVQRAEEAGLL